ncbi:MAG: type II secretion system protein [bacterium JZ-2024 1]
MRKGFTLIELLVVITIIGILISLAMPNFIKVKDKALEAEVKGIIHAIRTQLERYAADHDGLYPEYIFGGDVAGWTDGQGVAVIEALARDPLIWGGYLTSYQRNAFMKDGRSLCQRTNYDPRFGCITGVDDVALGQIVGNILSDPNYPGADDAPCPTPAQCRFGTESPGAPESTGNFPKLTYYFIGDDYTQTVDWIPGEFIYRSFGTSPATIRQLNIVPGSLTRPGAFSIDRYILGGYGSTRTAGKDPLHCATTTIQTLPAGMECNPLNAQMNRTYFVFVPFTAKTQCSGASSFDPANIWMREPTYSGLNRNGEVVCPYYNIAFVPSRGPVQTSGDMSLPNADGRSDGIVIWFGAGTEESVGH